MRFAEAAARIDRASSFAELADGRALAEAYRKWAKLVHPDAVGAAESATATRAFAKLSRLYAARGFASGDIADLSVTAEGLLKVPRSPADNDLMENEAAALERLWDRGDPKFRPYAPRLVRSYVHESADRKRLRVNVIEKLDGFVPLSRLRKPLDWRDAAWMWRRLLVGLGWAHRAGVVHGAVLEEHVLIHPAAHGVALVDWCYSGRKVTAIVRARRDAYPEEVLHLKTASPATDIYMATGLMARLIGDGMPSRLRKFADGCRYDAPRMRPQDAWRLLGELDELLGPRKFRPFTV
ncbi:MAG TPA: molecular chaperone DnaJ [Actinoplanes sp.]|nr:molecular chaperone DnaJ [Actinoplanes sp.]